MKKNNYDLIGLVFAGIAAFAVTSCASTKNAVPAETGIQAEKDVVKTDLSGNWRLMSFKKGEEAQSICDVSLLFKKEKDGYFVAGESGVNCFNGNIKVAGNLGMDLGGFAMTRMMGPKPAMEFEDLYIHLFEGEFTLIPSKKDGNEILSVENLKNGLSAEYVRIKENVEQGTAAGGSSVEEKL